MATTRQRNGRWYFRITLSTNGRTRYIERGSYASDCIAAGMPPESVQKRLGHKNLTTTYRYYVHETESQHEEAKQILEAMYSLIDL